MTIARKIALALALVAGSLTCLLLIFQRPILVSKFQELQKQKASDNLHRCFEVVDNEVVRISRDLQDWSSWDDTYDYALDHNDAYSKSNFRDTVFDVSDLDFVWVVDLKQNVVGGNARTPGGKISLMLPGVDIVGLACSLSQEGGRSLDFTPRAGIGSIGGTTAFFAVRPVLDGDETKEPVGVMIMGRYLNQKRMQNLVRTAKTQFSINSVQDVMKSPGLARVIQSLDPKKGFTELPRPDREVVGYFALKDERGKVSYILSASTTPDVLVEGISTISDSYRTMVLAFLLAIAIGMSLIYFTVSAPIKSLSSQVASLKPDEVIDFKHGFGKRSDELGVLARAFSDLGERLESAKTRLMLASRDAGMADIAREVLHNAGNLLNSLSISATQIETLSNANRHTGLEKSVALLSERRSELGFYFEDGQKGAQLIAYLSELAQTISNDQKALQNEVTILKRTATHLSGMIQQQADLATTKDQQSKFKLEHVLNDVRQIMEPSLARHSVSFVYNVDKSIVCAGNPGKLLQLIVNLVTNAKEAVKDQPSAQRAITVDACMVGEDRYQITVTDTGIGIEASEMGRIFNQGYSTKEKGMGIGLHFCYNASKEMGGELSAASDGFGRGARFSLILPTKINREEAA